MRLFHNTILGDLLYDGENCDPLYHHVKSNIVMGRADIGSGDCMVLTHNDVLGGLHAAPGDSVFSNISVDPLFCSGSTGDYTVAKDSPCVGSAHDAGDIGAFGVGCGLQSIEVHGGMTWGRIKDIYRR
jgi:hypothetical protein